jgi:RNA polymerase sigma factor (sigma-70 family)
MPYQAPKANQTEGGEGCPTLAPGRVMDDVFSLVYEELRRLASYVRRNEANVTLNSTALVHEAWLKLKDSPQLAAKEVSHFKAIAAKAMRQVLVDEARRKGSRKRGGSGEAIFVALSDSVEEHTATAGIFAAADSAAASYGANSSELVGCAAQLLKLDTMLQELSRLNPRQAQIVESRFFGGLNVDETAAILGVSKSSIERDWRAAKAWLASKIRPGKDSA